MNRIKILFLDQKKRFKILKLSEPKKLDGLTLIDYAFFTAIILGLGIAFILTAIFLTYDKF